MTATLQLETKKYQVFDLGYGIVLINKNMEDVGLNEKVYSSVFFQGDDAESFLKEVEVVNSKKIKDEFIDHWLSGYDSIMTIDNTKEDFDKLGINVRSIRKSKNKNF